MSKVIGFLTYLVSLFLLPSLTQAGVSKSLSLNYESAIECRHYWEHHGRLEASNKTIGQDVGVPPSDEYERTGTYLCRVALTKKDVLKGLYLFIGEVGDASYLEIIAVNGKKVSLLPINHGLSPDPSDAAVYTRYLPFVVSARDIFIEDGIHELKIRYRDLFPFQTGIRSGPPTIESLTGVFRRAVLCSPTFTFHVIQILIFALLSVAFLTWPRLHWKNRLTLFAASLAATLVILQLSAIPRSFLPQVWATRLNDFSQLLSFPFLFAAIFVFFCPNNQKWRVHITKIHLLFSIIAVMALYLMSKRDDNYLFAYGIWLFLLGGLPCLLLAYGINKRWISFTASPTMPKFSALVFSLLGALYALDVINLVIFKSRFYYFNHFFYFSVILLLIWRFQSSVSPNEVNLRKSIEDQNKRAFSVIANNTHNQIDTLELFTKDLASLIKSNRISIQAVVDGMLRFVGHYGNYKNIQNLHEIRIPSIVDEAIRTKITQFRRLPATTQSEEDTDVVVLPLENNSEVIGVLCATDFDGGHLSRFYIDRIDTIKNECEPVLALLLSERKNRAKDQLIQMMRNRTHPLQLSSEEYFLKNFEISPIASSHAFIYGDLVGSVELNEKYKNSNKVESAIDQYLSVAWDRFKHLGVVVSRTKGDTISFVVPNQSFDKSEGASALRCYEILKYLANASTELRLIRKKYGISEDLQFRFAMSMMERALTTSQNDASLRSFNLLVEETIDAAARVVSNVALGGECLIMEPAKRHLGDLPGALELEPQRLKGKTAAVRLWSLNGNILLNAS